MSDHDAKLKPDGAESVSAAELVVYYMDATDYEHELGNCTVALYASVADLMASRICAAECGIVAVRVELLRVVERGPRS